MLFPKAARFLAWALLFLTGGFAFAAEPDKNDVFRRGVDGYDTYRIPSIVVTKDQSVLAFCEGRLRGSADSGDVDVVVKRSTDGGRTFGPQQIVWDDGENTCGNPCVVLDRETGVVLLLMTHNLGRDNEQAITKRQGQGTRTVWLSKSVDDGRTWTRPVEITASVKDPRWSWYATGPGAGIQLRSGRLVVPCDHWSDDYYSHVVISDDHGDTWQRGGAVGPGCNECEVVELADGTLLLNMRNYKPPRSSRAVATSTDQGSTWSAVRLDPTLIEPTCQASIRRFSWPDSQEKSRVIFSNPATQKARANLTIRVSYDDCRSWPEQKILHAGPAAYSCIAVSSDKTVLCLYENGENGPSEKITLARFTLNWCTDGRDR